MTELQSALLLRRQLAGERRGAGPRSRTDEPLASCRPLGGRVVEGRGPRGWEPAGLGRPATLLARLWRVLGAGTRPSLALGRAGRPRRLPPPPQSWGVAGEGRGSRPGRPSLRGGSRAQGRRAKLLARQHGVRGVRADNKSDGRAGLGTGRGAPRTRRGARLGFACLRLARARAAPPVWGRVGAGAKESRSLAGRGFVLGAAPAPAQARSHRAVARLRFWPGAAAKCLPRGVSVPPSPIVPASGRLRLPG
ncbi:hypothetical protein NN561_004073 [Cricetulus griseus]